MNACVPLCPAPPLVSPFSIVVQKFTGAGTYTYMPSSGLAVAVVELVGAGGGGGGVLHADGWNGGGGGGGSGGYSRKILPAALVLGGVIVTIGAGGGSTAYPGVTVPQAGSTSFGGLCLAYGGWGGITIGGGGAQGQTGEGGEPAQVGIGDVALGGVSGGPGSYADVAVPAMGAIYGGRGGIAPVLGGHLGRQAVIFAAGFMDGRDPYTGDPQGPGCGGNGGVAWTAASDCGGGNGGPGLCVVTEYCWGSGSGGSGSGSGMVNVPACPPGQWGFDG